MPRLVSMFAVGATVLGMAVAVVATAQDSSAAAVKTSTAPKLVYVPIKPGRIVNTTTGADGNHKGAIAAGAGISPTVTNVPSTAAAVAVTLTAFSSTAAGALVTYQYGKPRPVSAMLQFAKGQTVSEYALVPMASRKINIANTGTSGSTQLLVDVTGYYTTYTGGSSVGLTHLLSPSVRVADTTKGTDGNYKGLVKAQTGITPVVTGFAGASPTATTGEVIASVSVSSATKAGAIVAYEGTMPTESSLHFDAGKGTSALVIVPTDSTGHIRLFNNSAGSVNLKVDVEGWVEGGPAEISGAFQNLQVTRPTNGSSVGANGNYSIDLHGRGGVPLAASPNRAVWITVHVQSPAAAGALTVETGGTSPAVRTLSFAAGQTVSSSILVPLSSGGDVTVHNSSSGKVSLFLDVYGYVAGNSPVAPATSPGRYVQDVTDASVGSMTARGTADRGKRFVLLEFGAQTSDRAGVQLTGSAGTKVSYAGVAAAVQAYLAAFASTTPGTVAIGTNNDGTDWTSYTGGERGTRWAGLVNGIDAPSHVTVVGADDIEPGFFSTEAQAAQWVQAYTATSGIKELVFNGSSDGCPTAFGATSDCSYKWTPKQIYAMAHQTVSGSAPIVALPQVYFTSQAEQWANIDLAGGKGLAFAGVLTEHGTDSSTFSAVQGWTALYRTLTAVLSAPSLPGPVDLSVDAAS
ncbi:hypothetical protein [Jatrophihabitans sp.]|uniref:hypothetical protein n=1 Tax=Jatrophihabitans sp. TaxID=1932789 RepID=UPI0030C6A89B|nr:polysaccharide deacetylase [Jatrophihabitans sp.]